MAETKEMKRYMTVIGVLGMIQVILLTLVGLYFYRLGRSDPANNAAAPPEVFQSR